MGSRTHGLPERVCPICKKLFILPPENTYKLLVGGILEHYCSYTCYRVEQKKKEAYEKQRWEDDWND